MRLASGRPAEPRASLRMLPLVSYSSVSIGSASVWCKFSPLEALVGPAVENSAHGIIKCPEGAISPWKHLVPGGKCFDSSYWPGPTIYTLLSMVSMIVLARCAETLPISAGMSESGTTGASNVPVAVCP